MLPRIIPKSIAGNFEATQTIRKVLRKCVSGTSAAMVVGVLKRGEGVHRGATKGNFQVRGECVWVDSGHVRTLEQKQNKSQGRVGQKERRVWAPAIRLNCKGAAEPALYRRHLNGQL